MLGHQDMESKVLYAVQVEEDMAEKIKEEILAKVSVGGDHGDFENYSG